MQNLKVKIRAETKEQSNEIQKLANSIGVFRPYSGWQLHKGWVCLDGKEMLLVCDSCPGGEEEFKTITLPELRAMVNPMKEYLVKTKEGEYHYINDSYDTCPAYVDKIEIPEGAEALIKYQGRGEGNFIKFGYPSLVWTGLNWSEVADGFHNAEDYINDGDKIVWQRATHPEELPFIDDEPKSLNDQYAEIEQVRQQTIEETLAERQAQYGCFEDVARTTGKIMEALSEVRVNGLNDLPYPHRMALYMIASKMARIVNGDPDYADNWHDIAGYAKLVEDTI